MYFDGEPLLPLAGEGAEEGKAFRGGVDPSTQPTTKGGVKPSTVAIPASIFPIFPSF